MQVSEISEKYSFFLGWKKKKKKKKKKMLFARPRELLRWGTNFYFSSMFFFSTCATDFAEKEELLVVLYCYRRWH